ncbi:hypothetical protein B0H14DRAFT_3432402 [Mycena olivaceomarginata]|nr:hypothetical protein B0H14DRAFT_3432402 [Mycena olivaceomarginata]
MAAHSPRPPAASRPSNPRWTEPRQSPFKRQGPLDCTHVSLAPALSLALPPTLTLTRHWASPSQLHLHRDEDYHEFQKHDVPALDFTYYL